MHENTRDEQRKGCYGMLRNVPEYFIYMNDPFH